MKHRISFALASCGLAVAIVACASAKAPEAPTNAATPEPLASDGHADADTDGDARVPGLPMPQKFPHFVWDAAGATH